MSKKDKSKFRKQIKAQLLQDVAQAQSQIKTPEKAKIISQENTVIANKIAADGGLANSAKIKTIEENTEFNLPQIRYDLKKTGIVVLGLAIVIGTLYYIDLKNNLLLSLGDWLFKVLNIQ